MEISSKPLQKSKVNLEVKTTAKYLANQRNKITVEGKENNMHYTPKQLFVFGSVHHLASELHVWICFLRDDS